MSTRGVTASGGAQGAQEADSVFDFLYHDSARIGSFLSQFDASGLLTGIRHTDAVTKGSKRGYSFGVGGEVPLLGGGNISFERQPGESGSDAMERSYDPLWANAREFLDALDARGLIKTFVSLASLGEFVLSKGRLWLIDTALVHVLYGKENFSGVALSKGAERAGQTAFDFDEATVEIELISSIPPQLQFYLHSTGDTIWSTLRPEGLVTPASEIAAKHGVAIDGEWHVLGIKDANPTTDQAALEKQDAEIEAHQAGRPYMSDAIHVANRIRNLFGRPGNCYGVTPLLIFRKVGR